jgi:NADPH-dependent curcumin reductase CurA
VSDTYSFSLRHTNGSAVGSIFVQIAKNIVGCKTVIGIAGGKEKCDWVKSLGADECIDYKVRFPSIYTMIHADQ